PCTPEEVRPMFRLSDFVTVPVDDWVEALVKGWLVPTFRPFFRAVQWPIDHVLRGLDAGLQLIPSLPFTIILALLAWRLAGRGTAILTAVGFALIDVFGIWPQAMTTLAMVLTAVIFCVVVGVPLGILAARSDRFERGL